MGERRPEWDPRTTCVRREEYNALRDPNMRHYFQNHGVQTHLYKTGQIDRCGRVIDLERNKSKLHIIEQEFKAAERLEYWRKKEEEDMRHRVQKKRHEALERSRRQEKLLKMKEDRKIRQELVRAARGLTLPQNSADRHHSSQTSFITEAPSET